ncbi:MAG: ABC transporter substrate-binding protein [Elusimicrobia bacterium]|nr:ABC transporter substrate-binding protein [Elusimicrobiota bacterium]
MRTALIVLLATSTVSGFAGTIPASGFPRTIQSGTDPAITLAAPPRRIVSVVLAVDHILSALVDKSRIQAVTQLAEDPYSSHIVEWAKIIPHKLTVNAEQIIACAPDLVFVARYTHAETVKLLQDAGLPILRLENYSSIRDIQANIIRVGEAVGAEEKAQKLVGHMDERLALVEKKIAKAASRPKVIHYIPKGFTSGTGTTLDEVIVRAGGINVAAEAGQTGFRKISMESLIALDPEVILISVYKPGKIDLAAQLYADPALRTIRAIRDHRVYSLPGRDIGAVDQFIVDGVEETARVLHPELFPTP